MPPGKKSEKGSTVAGNGKGATRFGPKGPATTGAVRERARRGTLKYKEGSSGALPGQETGGRSPESVQAERSHHSREGSGKTEKCCEASIQGQLRAVQRR